MREVVYTMIAGNPNIKQEGKPHRPSDIFKITDDKEKVKPAPPTKEEIEMVKNVLLK